MAPVLSYITFPASETFIKEKDQARHTIEELTKVDGIISSYVGLQVEEEGAKHGYLISTWQSPEKLQAFRDSAGDKFNSILSTLTSGEITRYHFVASQRIPEPALESKVTEFVVGKPKAGQSGDAFKAAAIKMSDALEAVGHGSAIGESIDGSGAYLLAAGWDSSAQHWETAKKDPIPAIDAEIKSIADITITHVSLTKRS
ncbi:hypothetical protein GYMLUDRAFT_46968 [Collybiopsis luxurians FD-317 M1]|uniref:ABM domain-containing protein n=1 Tax=Collybiopsis luxurians FD-317 M1 TaxID=944289 RepID=A0A0D0CN31_9AGAR|nr:hypothetical protein GYMLUDRAFT_46968 [Collybiopsis luxurians FD-317 M1]